MIRRRELEPPLAGDFDITLEQLIAHVRQWQADTLATVEVLGTSRHQVEEQTGKLENPQAALQLADFFTDFFLRAAADLDRVLEGLAGGPQLEQVVALKQLAAAAAAEERRAVVFRDRWVNKPLPYEDMRPVLDRLSAAARDQLLDYRQLTEACARIKTLIAPVTPPEQAGKAPETRAFDRRALFTRFIPKPDDKT
jgi:hypothetical protein